MQNGILIQVTQSVSQSELSLIEWLVMVNDIPDITLCLISFLVLHSTTCGYICIHQQAGQSNTMKEHTQTTFISATYFPYQNNILMDICQMFLLRISHSI